MNILSCHNFFMWFFFFTILIVVVCNNEIKLNTNSMFYPKNAQIKELIKNDKVIQHFAKTKPLSQTCLLKEIEIESELTITNQDVRICLNRVLQKELNDYEKDLRIYLFKDNMLISQKSQLIGWNHFPLHLRLNPLCVNFPKDSILDISSSKHQACTLTLVFRLKNNKVSILSSDDDLSCSDSDVEIFSQASNFIIQKFEEELKIHKIRLRQQAKYQEAANKFKDEQFKRKLKDIINPDKKSRKKWKAPIDSCSSSGRYTPSEATRARRQVKSR